MDLFNDAPTVAGWVTENRDLLGFVLGGGGGVFALWRFWDEQKWRRNAFAFDYAEKLLDDPGCRLALDMLDWTNGETPVPETLGNPEETVAWDVDSVAHALRTHEGTELFDDNEVLIRDAFDRLLDRLDRLGYFIRKRVIQKADFPNTLLYYIRLMDEQRLGAIPRALSEYMTRYGYSHAKDLFAMFGLRTFRSSGFS